MDPRIVALTVEQLGVDEMEVVFTASFVEDLNADSLDLVEYMLALEETFHIKIPDEDISVLMRSIGDIQNYLVEKGVLQDAKN
ncbi:acyl carrier protein [Ktedonobacter racemifer]|uniref:acyl carrier protein n=1 Tax=Ktedonobacter racemifer TaxID=363277 RepID=UPI00058E09F2|nr:acyl carrier protein [Ktedonobacter racemifer]